MSGRRIDDHSFWAGKRGKGTVFPEEAKMKEVAASEGAGHLGSRYPDTEEEIHRTQEDSKRKAKEREPKPGYRY
jgi:stringent starvation protein B